MGLDVKLPFLEKGSIWINSSLKAVIESKIGDPPLWSITVQGLENVRLVPRLSVIVKGTWTTLLVDIWPPPTTANAGAEKEAIFKACYSAKARSIKPASAPVSKSTITVGRKRVSSIAES